MSIFDGMSPEQIGSLLSINQGNNGLDLTIAGQRPPNIWNSPMIENYKMSQDVDIPLPPHVPGSSKAGDVSGFASYGMEAPGLPNPMLQMGGLMGMMGNQNQNQKPPMTPVKGGLMAYLESLGV